MHPLHPILSLAPFEKWGIDYIGPITPVTPLRRNCYILLAMDYATKWVEARATRKDDALTTTRFLFEQIFTRFGPPLKLVSDHGTHFLNNTVATLTEKYRVKHWKTTPYHPKCNGLTKRANEIIGKILNESVAEHKHDWDIKLFSVVYAYSLAYKAPTGQTPYVLVFGQHALVPIEFEIPTPRVSIEEQEPERLSLEERSIQIEALEEARLISAVQVEHKQELTKRRYDKPLKDIDLQDNDYVLLYDNRYMHFPGKLHKRWMGPYQIECIFKNGTIQLLTLTGERFPKCVHYDRVKPYYFQEDDVCGDAAQLSGELCEAAASIPD
ncbi:unnamed protein product [Calypogeia fissa]